MRRRSALRLCAPPPGPDRRSRSPPCLSVGWHPARGLRGPDGGGRRPPNGGAADVNLLVIGPDLDALADPAEAIGTENIDPPARPTPTRYLGRDPDDPTAVEVWNWTPARASPTRAEGRHRHRPGDPATPSARSTWAPSRVTSGGRAGPHRRPGRDLEQRHDPASTGRPTPGDGARHTPVARPAQVVADADSNVLSTS